MTYPPDAALYAWIKSDPDRRALANARFLDAAAEWSPAVRDGALGRALRLHVARALWIAANAPALP